MLCNYCDQEVPDEAAFCNHCGRSLQTTEATQGGLDSRSTSPLSAPGTSPSFYAQTLPIYKQTPAVDTASLPPSRLQRLLEYIFQPALARNGFFGIVLGGLFAALAGALASWLIFVLTGAIVQNQSVYGADTAAIMLNIAPLHVDFRNVLQLYLVMHGVGLHIKYATAATAVTALLPLHGLLVVPALLLTAGGYIAASTDNQNRGLRNLLLGAGIAIPYTILLLIMASQVNGDFSYAPGYAATLTMDVPTLLGFGLLWAALFGALGASLKLARGQWRHMLRTYMQSSRHPQITGMIAGALSATGLGAALSLLFVVCLLTYSTYSSSVISNILCSPGGWLGTTFWGIVQGPLHALNLFFLSLGAPISVHNSAGGCFYGRSVQEVLTLRDSSLHLPIWIYSVLVIPAISLFQGGRASVVIARVRGSGPGAVQGAVIALPFTILMILLALLGTVTNTYTSAATSSLSTTTTQVQSMGVGPIDILLWALLFSGVVGALGGAYQTSSLQIAVSRGVVGLGRLLAVLATPGILVLDALSGLPHSSKRSSARSLLYGAFLLALLLAIAAGLTGAFLISSNQILVFNDTFRIKDGVSVLIVAVTGLFLLCACVAALRRDPVAEE